jgi:hypothetical protein
MPQGSSAVRPTSGLYLYILSSVIDCICVVLNWFSGTRPEFITLRLWEGRVLLAMSPLSPMLRN